MKPKILWRDAENLGDGQHNRSAGEYFMHFYPQTHLAEMIEATGQTMEDQHRNVTQQEFFVLVGLLLLAAGHFVSSRSLAVPLLLVAAGLQQLHDV
jgi:hypothetical protein